MQEFVYKSTKFLHFCIFIRLQKWQICRFAQKGRGKWQPKWAFFTLKRKAYLQYLVKFITKKQARFFSSLFVFYLYS